MQLPGQLLVLYRLLGLSILLNVASSATVVKQVIVVTRHGSRFPLRKDANDLSEGTAGMLTNAGQSQMYKLGEWLRDHYASTGIFTTFDREKMRLESSSFERTVSSANSLAWGLFPPAARDPNGESTTPYPANVPVYTYDQDNDMLIRAYDKCTTFQNRLTSLYNSVDWRNLEITNKALLTKLAATTTFQPYSNSAGIVPLSNLWNVYDTIKVAETECPAGASEFSAACNALPDKDAATLLSDTEWTKVQELSHKAEVLKYGQITAGPMVGVMLLKEIVRRMKNNDYTFSLFSGHYPLLLGIFSALEDDFFEDQVIPDYASALIFEVTEDTVTGAQNFQLIFRSGQQSIPVPLDSICNGSTCDVADLDFFLKDWDAERWCRVCANDSTAECLKYELAKQKQLNNNPTPSPPGNPAPSPSSLAGSSDDAGDDGIDDGVSAAIGFLIGLAVGGFCVGALVYCMMYARKAKQHKTALEQDKDVATTAMEKMGEGTPEDALASYEEGSSNGTNGTTPSVETPPEVTPRTLD